MHRTVFQSGEDQNSKLDPARHHKRWEHTYRVGEAKTPGPEYIGLPPGKKKCIAGDGQCLYSALGFPFNLSGRSVRGLLETHGRQHPELFVGHGVGDWERFLHDTANENVWGGEAQIIVAASAFNAPCVCMGLDMIFAMASTKRFIT